SFSALGATRALHSFPTRRSSDLNTACDANRFNPNGGVYMPMLRLTVMTMPKWIGLMPTAWTSGSNSGVRMRIAAGGSRKLPMIRSEEHTSELQSLRHLVCRLLLE